MSKTMLTRPPAPDLRTGLVVLHTLLRGRSPLAALARMQVELGDIFRIPLPGFAPYVLVGPEANRFVLAGDRHRFRWRNEGDPVTELFQNGLLVLDGEAHDRLRRKMNPPLHRRMVDGYLEVMLATADEVSGGWPVDRPIDLLVEMRKIALLILMRTMFRDDFKDDYGRLLPSVLESLRVISPGPWIFAPAIKPRIYPSRIEQLDDYLFGLISQRRKTPGRREDLLSLLVQDGTLSDQMIRDQLITMLVAGHDTSTSLLSWALYQVAALPEVGRELLDELDRELGGLPPDVDALGRLETLDRVVKETLRLYPPIHMGARMAAEDLEYCGYGIPAGSRVIYSIYLTHRLERYWPDPDRFDPDRFRPERLGNLPPYTFLPFGGGPRNCIGFTFAQVEVKAVLARILQQFEIRLVGAAPRVHMGATLEPRPGVPAVVRPRGLKYVEGPNR